MRKNTPGVVDDRSNVRSGAHAAAGILAVGLPGSEVDGMRTGQRECGTIVSEESVAGRLVNSSIKVQVNIAMRERVEEAIRNKARVIEVVLLGKYTIVICLAPFISITTALYSRIGNDIIRA